MSRRSRAKPPSPLRYFHSSPEVIRLGVLTYIRFPLSLRNVEDLLFERGIDLCHETERFWWNRFGSMFAGEIRRQHVSRMRSVQANVHNHFALERHLVDRQTFKQRRSTALVEWREIAG